MPRPVQGGGLRIEYTDELRIGFPNEVEKTRGNGWKVFACPDPGIVGSTICLPCPCAVKVHGAAASTPDLDPVGSPALT
jgi:hypothetical protein